MTFQISIDLSHTSDSYLFLAEDSPLKKLMDPEMDLSEMGIAQRGLCLSNPEEEGRLVNSDTGEKITFQVEFLNLKSMIGESYMNKYLKDFSIEIDRASQQVFIDLKRIFTESKKFSDSRGTIKDFPENYENIEEATPQLEGLSAFEQMVLLSDWFHSSDRESDTRYTWCFSTATERSPDRKIPLSIEKNAKTLFQVKLGSRAEDYRAVKYDDKKDPCSFANEDPWACAKRENFIYLLEALEMVRQPNYIGATLIKGTAFEAEYIGSKWRYGTKGKMGWKKEACVEFRNQRSLSREKKKIKKRSAAFNVFKLIKRELGHVELCSNSRLEEIISVTPKKIFYAYQQGHKALYNVMFALMIAKVGYFSSEQVENFIKWKLELAK